MNFPAEKGNLKKDLENNVSIDLNILYAKKEKYILPMFQKITKVMKNKLFF